ncbi:MAG: DUF3387 domain-containing protein [Balneolaceae bacterium]|nr:DUF3387 domain-containing protein [Balneolaceae bacterium]
MSRLAKLDINQGEIEELSDRVEEIVEEYGSDSEREKAKSQWSTLEKLVGSEPRLKQELIAEAANHLLSLEDGKKRFLDTILSLNKAHSLCNTLDEVQELEKEIAFFNSIKTIINKYTSVDQKRQETEKNSILKQFLDNALVAEGLSVSYGEGE